MRFKAALLHAAQSFNFNVMGTKSRIGQPLPTETPAAGARHRAARDQDDFPLRRTRVAAARDGRSGTCGAARRATAGNGGGDSCRCRSSGGIGSAGGCNGASAARRPTLMDLRQMPHGHQRSVAQSVCLLSYSHALPR